MQRRENIVETSPENIMYPMVKCRCKCVRKHSVLSLPYQMDRIPKLSKLKLLLVVLPTLIREAAMSQKTRCLMLKPKL